MRKYTLKPLLLACLMIVMVSLFSGTAFGAIKIIGESGLDIDITKDVEKTANLCNQVFKDDFNIALNHDVTIVLCPTKAQYARVLEKTFKKSPEEAEGLSTRTSGISCYSVIVLNEATVLSPQGRTFAIAHDLFNQIKSQLTYHPFVEDSVQHVSAWRPLEVLSQPANHFLPPAPWLAKGSADLVGVLICEKRGFKSMETWKLQQINVKNNERSPASFYDDRSDLQVFYLTQMQGSSYKDITTYFGLIGKSIPHYTAFEQAFGITERQFLLDFQKWLAENAGHIEIVRSGTILDTAVADVEQTISLTRRFYKDKLNQELKSPLRIVLTGDKVSYAAAMAKEFGITPSEAEERANNKDSVWFSLANTVVLDVSLKPHQQPGKVTIVNTALLLSSRFITEALPPQTEPTSLCWLYYGSQNFISAQLMDHVGIVPIEKTQQRLLDVLTKYPALPDLTDLQTVPNWTAAKTQYNATILFNISSIATSYLVEQYGGFNSLSAWMKETRNMGNREQAFNKVYGMSPAEFSAKFKDYLATKLVIPLPQ